ncbi:MAG: DNA-binding domain-containing protein [Gammaproteobacteria bacterium]
MTSLEKLQNDFQTYLMKSDEKIALPHISPATPFSASQRLGVYHYAYRGRLKDVLADDFPKCFTLLGEEDFEKAAYHYLDTYPSHHFSVRYFGLYFSQFLKHTAPYDRLPVLSEMVRFEWAAQSTLDAKDEPLLKYEDLSRIAADEWPNIIFKFHPSVRIESFEWDTVSIWREIDQEQPPREPKRLEAPITWLLWRNDLRCYFKSLSTPQQLLAQSIQQALPFGDICERMCTVLPESEVPTTAMETLLGWVNGGVLASP